MKSPVIYESKIRIQWLWWKNDLVFFGISIVGYIIFFGTSHLGLGDLE